MVGIVTFRQGNQILRQFFHLRIIGIFPSVLRLHLQLPVSERLYIGKTASVGLLRSHHIRMKNEGAVLQSFLFIRVCRMQHIGLNKHHVPAFHRKMYIAADKFALSLRHHIQLQFAVPVHGHRGKRLRKPAVIQTVGHRYRTVMPLFHQFFLFRQLISYHWLLPYPAVCSPFLCHLPLRFSVACCPVSLLPVVASFCRLRCKCFSPAYVRRIVSVICNIGIEFPYFLKYDTIIRYKTQLCKCGRETSHLPYF